MTAEEESLLTSNLLVDDVHKLVLCRASKSGSMSWRGTLLILSGKFKDIEEIYRGNMERNMEKLPSLSRYNKTMREIILKTYRKMMVVREPISRFVSCYRDKFLHVNTGLRRDLCTTVVNYVNSIGRNHIGNKMEVSITEFAEFAYHTAWLPMRRQHHHNRDWRPIVQECQPCHVDYDYYVDFETMAEDGRYLLKLLDAPDDFRIPWKNASGNTTVKDTQVLDAYLSQMPVSFIKKIMKIY